MRFGRIVIGAAVALCCVACGSLSPTETPRAEATPDAWSPASGWQTFVSPRYGYSIAIPVGWFIEEVAGSGGLHPGEPGTDTFRGDNRLLTVIAMPAPSSTVATWRSPITEHYEGPEPGHGLSPESDVVVTVAGEPGRLREYRLASEPNRQLVLDATVVIDGRAYLLTYIGLAGEDGEYRQEFSVVLDSFRPG